MLYSNAICKCCGSRFLVHDYDVNTPSEEYCPDCLQDLEERIAGKE